MLNLKSNYYRRGDGDVSVSASCFDFGFFDVFDRCCSFCYFSGYHNITSTSRVFLSYATTSLTLSLEDVFIVVVVAVVLTLAETLELNKNKEGSIQQCNASQITVHAVLMTHPNYLVSFYSLLSFLSFSWKQN